jgi:hypothetical protein
MFLVHISDCREVVDLFVCSAHCPHRVDTADKGRTTNGAADPVSRSRSHYTLASHIGAKSSLPSTGSSTPGTTATKDTIMGDATSTLSPLSFVPASPVTSAKSKGPSASLENAPAALDNNEVADAVEYMSSASAFIAIPETSEDQVAKQTNKRTLEELAAEDGEQLKRRKNATTADVKTAQSESAEVKAFNELDIQNGDGAAGKDETSSADELAEPNKPARKAKAKAKAKAAPKRKPAPSRRGSPACPECKRRKVCRGSKLCLSSPHSPFHR